MSSNPIQYDRLQESFSGPALDSLQRLGVHAYNAVDLEQSAAERLEQERSIHESKRVQFQIAQLTKQLRDVKNGKTAGDVLTIQADIAALESGALEQGAISTGGFSHENDLHVSVKRIAPTSLKQELLIEKDRDGQLAPLKKRKRNERVADDADDFEYQNRLSHLNDMEESKTEAAEFVGGFIVPGHIYDRLFYYQKTALQWLWELHKISVGGIVGDAMGLGKTVTMISFLAGLSYSPGRNKLGPHIILCPASIMGQWLAEFRRWWPQSRIMLLHESGNHQSTPRQIVSKALKGGSAHVIITTYESLRVHHALLLPHRWGYAILDEGHRIRNPDAAMTLLAKHIRTPHRVILSGSPIQNHLKELWSLFDFIFPGKLGTLPVFEEEFCEPITKGGYVHASKDQVQIAYHRAVLLRDMITPHILRRVKSDVLKHLPQKSEQILFCSLTLEQKTEYKLALSEANVSKFRSSQDMRLFKTISVLRKICNHPDLLRINVPGPHNLPDDYGAVHRSGKLKVTEQILSIWKQESHRVLLFSQTRQCLDIIENMVSRIGHEYRRVDGSTPVKSRQSTFDEFNQNIQIFILLLTTRAGGFGLNLTGADRVLVFDPDWNPATDEQAQERAYRIGQTRNVAVLRLITRGTIEEKVYHRQIFKQLLTNRILEDPTQQRFFSNSDLKDLFSFIDEDEQSLETSDIFQGVQEAETRSTDAYQDGTSELIRCLFDNTDLSTVFSHEKLMSSSSTDKVKEKSEAVAKKAIESLRSSQNQLLKSRIDKPTWTGRHGNPAGSTFARADNVARWVSSRSSSSSADAGLSSQQLLSEIKERKSASSNSPTMDVKTLLLLKNLREYLTEHSDGVDSDILVRHFRSRIHDLSDQHVFKHLLRHMAVLEKHGSSRRWRLKPSD